jgi:hypothetical protein
MTSGKCAMDGAQIMLTNGLALTPKGHGPFFSKSTPNLLFLAYGVRMIF